MKELERGCNYDYTFGIIGVASDHHCVDPAGGRKLCVDLWRRTGIRRYRMVARQTVQEKEEGLIQALFLFK